MNRRDDFAKAIQAISEAADASFSFPEFRMRLVGLAQRIAELDRAKEKGMEKDGRVSDVCDPDSNAARVPDTGVAPVSDPLTITALRDGQEVTGRLEWQTLAVPGGSETWPHIDFGAEGGIHVLCLADSEWSWRFSARVGSGFGYTTIPESQRAKVRAFVGAGPPKDSDPNTSGQACEPSPPAGPAPVCCSECADGWTYEDSDDDGHPCNCPRGQQVALNWDLDQLRRIFRDRTPEQVVQAMGEETRRTIAIHVLRAVDWSELSDEDGNEGTGREAMLVRHTAELRGALTKTEREREEALARAEKVEARVEPPENQEDGHPCEYCGEPCLYGSRHPRCHEKAQREAVRAMGAAAKSRATALELLDAMDVLVNGEPTSPDRECYRELADDIRRGVAAIPTWQPIADLPKVRTRPVVMVGTVGVCFQTCSLPPEWPVTAAPSWATHFIYAPEGE